MRKVGAVQDDFGVSNRHPAGFEPATAGARDDSVLRPGRRTDKSASAAVGAGAADGGRGRSTGRPVFFRRRDAVDVFVIEYRRIGRRACRRVGGICRRRIRRPAGDAAADGADAAVGGSASEHRHEPAAEYGGDAHGRRFGAVVAGK